MKQEVQKVMH